MQFTGRGKTVKVVIVGDRSRESPQDVILVNTIMDYCKEKYPKLRVVTKGVDRGVGKMIKTRLTDPVTRRPREIDWMEVSLQHHLIGEDIPKMEFSSDYDALNSVLLELGDEFHILSEERPRGVTMNLLRRVQEGNLPFSLYKPRDTVVKPAQFQPIQEMKNGT
jgi:hypothetical protein